MMEGLNGLTVAEWAPPLLVPPPVTGPDTRATEVAARTARPDGAGLRPHRTVTAPRLMQHSSGAR